MHWKQVLRGVAFCMAVAVPLVAIVSIDRIDPYGPAEAVTGQFLHREHRSSYQAPAVRPVWWIHLESLDRDVRISVPRNTPLPNPRATVSVCVAQSNWGREHYFPGPNCAQLPGGTSAVMTDSQ